MLTLVYTGTAEFMLETAGHTKSQEITQPRAGVFARPCALRQWLEITDGTRTCKEGGQAGMSPQVPGHPGKKKEKKMETLFIPPLSLILCLFWLRWAELLLAKSQKNRCF